MTNYEHLTLGKATDYSLTYSPDLLQGIPRVDNRRNLGIKAVVLPFFGVDIWTVYELSWLEPSGKPHVAIAEITFPCTSAVIIESKSLKLYFNSFNRMTFESWDQVYRTIERDLTQKTGATISVKLFQPDVFAFRAVRDFVGEYLDDQEVEIDTYRPDPGFLDINGYEKVVYEALYSNLFRCNCPVTGQPDWASIQIRYTGYPVSRSGLLKYLISYREHRDFHENCVERIFMDLMEACEPLKLEVYARFNRRGGIDINPYRCTEPSLPEYIRSARQ